MFRMRFMPDGDELYVTVGIMDDLGDLIGDQYELAIHIHKDDLESYFEDAEPGVLILAREVMEDKRDEAIVELIPRTLRYSLVQCAWCDEEGEYVLKTDLPGDFDPEKHLCDECKKDDDDSKD